MLFYRPYADERLSFKLRGTMLLSEISDGREEFSNRATIRRHRHASAYAAIILRGEYEEAGEAGRRRVRSGDVLIHGAFDAHCDRFGRAGAELLNLKLPSRTKTTAGRIADIDGIVRLAERDAAAAALRLLSEVEPEGKAEADWPDLLAGALMVNPALRLGEWARAHGLAPETLSRGFRQIYEVTPARFRAEIRAREAWSRILESARPLAQVALEVGFADQAHMTRAVTAMTGSAPGALRRIKFVQDRARW